MSSARPETLAAEPRIRRRQWAALSVLWLFLLSPILLQPLLGAGRGRFDALLLFNAVTSLLWIGALHFSCRRPLVLHALLAPLYVATVVDLFLIGVFGNRLSSGYIGIILSDYSETGEFISSYLRPLAIAAAVLLLVYGTGLYALRGARLHHRRGIALGFVAVLLLIYGVLAVRGVQQGTPLRRTLMDLVGKEMSAPMGGVFQTGLAVALASRDADLRRARQTHSLHAHQVRDHPGALIVWVIGESSRPQNWSLFGYHRPTTPRLAHTPGVIALTKVLTTAPHTAVAVPSMLSLKPITEWTSVMSEPSIVSAFKECGFDTYWLSAQEADAWAGTVPQLAAEAATRRYFDRAFDGAMLPTLRAILGNAAPNRKLFIVLHTKGSHFQYSRRYPPSFNLFTSAVKSGRSELVDSYDNSIAYTDWFLSEVIAAVAQRKGYAALLYASDHGENLLDDDRHLFGHALGTRYDLETAAFVWLSEGLRAQSPEMAAAAQRNAAARLSLSNLPHSMLELAGIEASGWDPRQSIFDARFAEQPRWYMVRGQLREEPSAMH